MHLRREVTEVTPAVDRLFTRRCRRWRSTAVTLFEIKVMLGYLGMVFATNPPGERDAFATDLSLYVRLGYKVVGRDRTVLTPTPPLHVVGRGRVGRNRNRPRTRIGGRH